MALKRADHLTGTVRQQEFFSDFLDNFNMTPYGNDVARVTNEKAVNQSIRNLIKTNLGERLFQPTIGGNINATLFELNGQEIMDALELNIRQVIINNEPRAQLQQVTVETVDEEEHAIEITIVYNLINNPDPITITILKRVR